MASNACNRVLASPPQYAPRRAREKRLCQQRVTAVNHGQPHRRNTRTAIRPPTFLRLLARRHVNRFTPRPTAQRPASVGRALPLRTTGKVVKPFPRPLRYREQGCAAPRVARTFPKTFFRSGLAGARTQAPLPTAHTRPAPGQDVTARHYQFDRKVHRSLSAQPSRYPYSPEGPLTGGPDDHSQRPRTAPRPGRTPLGSPSPTSSTCSRSPNATSAGWSPRRRSPTPRSAADLRFNLARILKWLDDNSHGPDPSRHGDAA